VDPTQLTIALLAAIATILGAVATAFLKLYDHMVKDRDFWRDHALRGTDLADRATYVAEKVIGKD
jgi:small basic protein